MTGNVKVILSGGGFGESVMEVTHLWLSLQRPCPGNRDATWPSGPIPRSMRSNLGKPVDLDTRRILVLTKCSRQVS